MVIKIKEPLDPELGMLREGQILFTYFHLAGDETLTRRVLENKIIGIAYETIETDDGKLPLPTPMSEVVGRLAIQEEAKYLEKSFGGVAGVPPAKVVILGAGVVGVNAAQMAAMIGIIKKPLQMVSLLLPPRSATTATAKVGPLMVSGILTRKIQTQWHLVPSTTGGTAFMRKMALPLNQKKKNGVLPAMMLTRQAATRMVQENKPLTYQEITSIMDII